MTWTSACRHLSDGLETFGRRFGKTRRAYMSTLADATQKLNHDVKLLSYPLLALTGAASCRLDGPDKRRRGSRMSQKQSLLIASPSGREARTQDHLGIIYIS